MFLWSLLFRQYEVVVAYDAALTVSQKNHLLLSTIEGCSWLNYLG